MHTVLHMLTDIVFGNYEKVSPCNSWYCTAGGDYWASLG